MVSIMVWKNSMLRLSKALPQQPTCAFYPRRASRISITTLSSSESRYTGEDEQRNRKEAMKEGLENTKRAAEEMKGGFEDAETRRGARDLGDITEEAARSVSGKAKEGTERTGEKMQQMKNDAKQKAWETTERAKGSMHDTKESMHETKEGAKDKVKGAAEWTAEKAKEGSEGVGETVKGAWDAAKGAGQKVKETVVGKSDDEKTPEELMEDHLKKRAGDDPNRKIY